ncbi:hypothetical protein RRG08_052021 [Elysia crispata]|uniref:Uncharacterized protein n=1 Tax=Elysia crispata TaxID=231223 RepID=A0AAE0XRW8_9GAST|nr:hypothetical protein RRG08_052021 [Elysia crispata]
MASAALCNHLFLFVFQKFNVTRMRRQVDMDVHWLTIRTTMETARCLYKMRTAVWSRAHGSNDFNLSAARQIYSPAMDD